MPSHEADRAAARQRQQRSRQKATARGLRQLNLVLPADLVEELAAQPQGRAAIVRQALADWLGRNPVRPAAGVLDGRGSLAL